MKGDDLELLSEAVQWNPFALRFASSGLVNRKELVLKAVQAEGLALLYAGQEMRADKERDPEILNSEDLLKAIHKSYIHRYMYLYIYIMFECILMFRDRFEYV